MVVGWFYAQILGPKNAIHIYIVYGVCACAYVWWLSEVTPMSLCTYGG